MFFFTNGVEPNNTHHMQAFLLRFSAKMLYSIISHFKYMYMNDDMPTITHLLLVDIVHIVSFVIILQSINNIYIY